MSPLPEAALAYADASFRIHPCRPNRKEPILDNWPKLATCDPGIIAGWWRPRPNANVGIACGGPARLLAVDVDPDNGGEASVARSRTSTAPFPRQSSCSRSSRPRCATWGAAQMLDAALPVIAELTGLGARFLVWRLETRNGNATKVPFRPVVGHVLPAATDKPATLGTYAEAQAALASGKFDGIGFVCRPELDGIFVVDLDGCIDPETGEVAQWANDIVEQIDSFTEISPSGTGLKIFARGSKDLRFPVKSTKVDAPQTSNKSPQIEILANKYTTLTGKHFGGTPQEITEASGYLNNMARWLAEDRASAVREHSPPTKTPWTKELLLRAADRIPNDKSVDWSRWKEIGMRFWAATDGSEDALMAFDLMSRKHPDYDANETRKCWNEITRSPPTRFGVNSLLAEARSYDREFPDPAGLIGKDVDFSGLLAKAQKPVPDINRLRLVPPSEMDWRGAQLNLVAGILGHGMMALIYGESGSSKTLIAMSMAMHIALGRPWCGRKVRQGFVVYLAPEGGSSVHLRYHAWCRHHGIDPSDDSVLFRTIPVTMDLCRSDADLKQIIANIKAAEAELGPCVLVIVDTVSRALAGGDENAPKDMGSFVLNCDRLREQTGATVLGVHHTPANGDNPRGHTILKNGSEVRMRASKAATGLFKLKLDHLKDGAAGEELMFELQTAVVGTDDDDEEVAGGLVIESGTKVSPAPMRTKLTDRQVCAINALRKEGLTTKKWALTAEEFNAILTKSGAINVDGPDSSQRRQKSELRTQLLARNLIFMDGNAIRVTLAHA